MPGHEVTALRPPPRRRTRATLNGQQAAHALDFAERVALFVVSMHKEQSFVLLEGFAQAPRAVARRFAYHVAQLDSASRQARLAHEFGVRPDATSRLQALIAEAPPLLRCALARALPMSAKAQLPPMNDDRGAPGPALLDLARRLVREASRVSPERD